MKIRVLVLDFDGVITSLNINWKDVRSEVSKAVGFKVDSMLSFWENYFGTKLFNLANDVVEKYELEAAQNSKPYDDVKPALESFKGVTYLASMQSESIVNFFLDKYGFKKYFKEILGRNRFQSKAKQLQFIKGKERGCEKMLLIDDSRSSVEICRIQRVSCILLDRKRGDSLVDMIRRN